MDRKTWLITGVSSGFGYEMTTQLLARGDTVIGTVRNPQSVRPFLAQYPDTFFCERLDMTDTPGVRALVDAAFARRGRIDVVVSTLSVLKARVADFETQAALAASTDFPLM